MNSLFRCRSTYSLFYPLALPTPTHFHRQIDPSVVSAHVHNFHRMNFRFAAIMTFMYAVLYVCLFVCLIMPVHVNVYENLAQARTIKYGMANKH